MLFTQTVWPGSNCNLCMHDKCIKHGYLRHVIVRPELCCLRSAAPSLARELHPRESMRNENPTYIRCTLHTIRIYSCVCVLFIVRRVFCAFASAWNRNLLSSNNNLHIRSRRQARDHSHVALRTSHTKDGKSSSLSSSALLHDN